MLLRHLLEEGLPKTVIAERLGVSRAVIYHWITTGQLDRDVSTVPPRRERAPQPVKLDPYKEIIRARLASYPELSAARLFAECRTAGYQGCRSQLQIFVRETRPVPPAEPPLPVYRGSGDRGGSRLSGAPAFDQAGGSPADADAQRAAFLRGRGSSPGGAGCVDRRSARARQHHDGRQDLRRFPP